MLLTGYTYSMAQIQDPVSFTYSAKKINALTYEIHITAVIESGWHIYSQTTPDGGPIATTVKFNRNPLATLTGKVNEIGNLEKHFEKLFNVDVKQFNDKIDFVQTVKLRKSFKTNISGSIEFMVCNDHECLPPTTKKFSVDLK
jgi:thiol:disulfide interchange protein DsbD